MSRQVETERKYALAQAEDLPPLDAVATPGPVDEFDLVATYYDARDYRLTRAHLVIRRREGGHDDGWHLKTPGERPDERHELHLPLGPARVPDELREQVADALDGAALVPVAVLRTARREQQLLGPDGAVLAVTTLDRVEARTGDDRRAWREAEVELVGGRPELLDRIETVLGRAGIHRSPSASKIGQTLAGRIEALDASVGSAGAALLDYVGLQVGTLQAQEAAVRVDAPDAVHRSRVATRRLRSTLRTFAGLLPRGVAPALRTELRWHAALLGAARDAEVLRERLLDALDTLPHPAGEPVRRRIATQLSDTHDVAHAALVKSMGTRRYDELHEALASFLASPGLAWVAAEPAEVVLVPMLGRAVRRVRKLARHAANRPGDLGRWHEVRKAAKAARYGAEALVPVLGERADGWRSAWEAVTEALGSVQDCVVAKEVVAALAERATSEGLRPEPFEELRRGQDDTLAASLLAGRRALATALAEADPGAVG